MRLILMGPPGVGKGTQANNLKIHYNIIHLSTGDILRAELSAKTELGNRAKKYMDAGELVPDELLLSMMENRLQQDDCSDGYLLDGFPRTIPQAEGLTRIMKKLGHKMDAAVSLFADEDELITRLVLRGKTSGRSDDTEEVIKQRQKIYWKATAPLLDYYKETKLLKEVDGLGDIDEITQRIIGALS